MKSDRLLSFAVIKAISEKICPSRRGAVDKLQLCYLELDTLCNHLGFSCDPFQDGDCLAWVLTRTLSKLAGGSDAKKDLGRFFTEIIKLVPEPFDRDNMVVLLNFQLADDGHKLLKNKYEYELSPVSNVIDCELSSCDHVKSWQQKARELISKKDFPSVLTSGRTALEVIFDRILVNSAVEVSNLKEFPKKWKKVREILFLNPEGYSKPLVKTLTGGFGSIVTAINEMRNFGSDAHSHSVAQSCPKHHAELFANSVITLMMFLLSSHEYQQLSVNGVK